MSETGANLLRRLMAVSFPDQRAAESEVDACFTEACTLLGRDVVCEAIDRGRTYPEIREQLIDLVESQCS